MKLAKSFLAHQTMINGTMRSVATAWLWEIKELFGISDRSLLVAIAYQDRYLSTTRVCRQTLQLVSATSLWIACKYEEVYTNALEDFVRVCDGAYTKDDFFCMERDIVKALEFELQVQTPHTQKKYESCAAFVLSIYGNLYTFGHTKQSQMIRGIAHTLQNGGSIRKSRRRSDDAATIIGILQNPQVDTKRFANHYDIQPLNHHLQ